MSVRQRSYLLSLLYFCQTAANSLESVHNVSEIYKVPLLLKAQNVASIISTKLKMYLPKGMSNIQARRSECVCECVEARERERAGERVQSTVLRREGGVPVVGTLLTTFRSSSYYQIPHRPYRIGIGGQNPPSVIRSGWYRKMGLGIRDGDPKTDRTPVED